MSKEEYKYCAYIDVLGYKNIVQSNRSYEEKCKILESIYDNLLRASLNSIRTLKKTQNEDIFIKSFSDSIYFESKNPYIVLYSIQYLFATVLGHNFYSPTKEYTPLLRSGIAYDWTLHFMDIGMISSQPFEEARKNDDLKNVVGLGIAKAYITSEQSKLSGMRVIISPEVLNQITLTEYKAVPFECYYTECLNFLNKGFDNNETIELFLLPIRDNEEGKPVNLFELCWPVYRYFREDIYSSTLAPIKELIRMEGNFDKEHIRHLKRTAELLFKSFEIIYSIHPNCFPLSFINSEIKELKRLAGILS